MNSTAYRKGLFQESEDASQQRLFITELLKGSCFSAPAAHESPVGVGWWGFRGEEGSFSPLP